MIKNEDDFETALELATAQFEQPPTEGSPGHHRLMELLDQIAHYRPMIVQPETGDPVSDDRAHLADELKAFEARMPHHYADHWNTLVSDI
jgi:hypothetical protein